MDDKNYCRLAQFQAFINEYKYSMEKYDCIREIFKHDGDINYQIPDLDFIKQENAEIIGCTALHLALNEHKTGSFEKLLNHGADFTIKSNKGTTVLHQAIERSYNKSKMVWMLKGRLIHPRASLVLSAHVKYNNFSNPCDNDGMSHFHIACMLNHVGAVQFFLDRGISPNEAINVNSTKLPGYTSLHLAARYCSFETAQLLLKYNADKYSLDSNSMTPLHLLLERRMEIMDHMHMDKRAAFDFFKDELDVNERIVKLFIDSDDAQDFAGLSVFQVACTLQDTALIKRLLEQRVDVDHSVSENSLLWPGYTALHFSAHSNFKSVELLLSHGVKVFTKDAKGTTPFDLCLKRHQPEDLYLLLTTAMRQLNVEDIFFSDGVTKLADFVRAMQNIFSFATFMAIAMKDINMFIPLDSPLWPGYTLLHLAVVLPERIAWGIEELYETSDYIEEDCPMNYYNSEEDKDNFHGVRIIFMLEHGADVTIQDAHGSTPIHLAFPWKSERIFQSLLNGQNKILNPVDKNGLSHLHIACATRNQPFIERCLIELSDEVDDQIRSSFEYRLIDWGAEKKKVRSFSVNAGSTLLHIAVATCDFATIETLLQHNANIYARDSVGMTPIHLILKSTELVHQTARRFKDLLLSVENLTDCVTDFGLSHLHVASYANHATAIKKLLDVGASVDTKINLGDNKNESLAFLAPYDSYTPLQMALKKDNRSVCDILAQHGADFLKVGAELLLKMLNRKTPCRDIFVKQVKDDAAMQKQVFEHYGLTMLHIACITSDLDWAVELLSNGADSNVLIDSNFDKWSGYSPLHIAVIPSNRSGNQIEIIELLMKHGADVTLINPAGNTAVQELFHDNYNEECGYFEPMLTNPKDCILNPTNSKGVSHFHAACMADNPSIVEEFLKNGVDVNLKIDNFQWGYGGYTPLHLAVYHNYEDTIDMLLKYGADINARNRLGRTPFHTAAKHSMNFKNLCDKLVRAGADVHARTLLGATALEELKQIPWTLSEIELLVKYGYRVNSFNPLTQEGLIGLSLHWESDLSMNSFYEAVINASDARDVDDMGRTPLHNIVSCGGFKTSAEVIGEFLKIGYDIDHQDKQGRTALHWATLFRNENGIIGLLKYGADINIKDYNDKTAIMYFLEKSKSERENWHRKDALNILQTFVKHIYKLKLFKLHINALNSSAYDKMVQKINLEEQFSVECKNELKELRKKMIDLTTISLFDFLSSETRVIAAYPNMQLVKREAIDVFFNTNQNVLLQDFPHFHCLLRLQYRKVLARNGLVESAKYSFNIHIGFTMPDLCSNIIFVFLSNQDLKNLMSSIDDYRQPCKRQKLD